MKQIVAFAVIGTLIAASMVAGHAQNPPPQKEAPKSKLVTGGMTPARTNAEIEKAANNALERGDKPSPRFRQFFIAWGDNASEFAALGRYSVLLLVVISQKQEEFPVKRVYVRSGGSEQVLQQLSSWRGEVDPNTSAFRMWGPYRENGFYLVPGAALNREGEMLADLTVNREGLPIVKTPTAAARDRAGKYTISDPEPNAKPGPAALRAFIQRKFSGFPVPALR